MNGLALTTQCYEPFSFNSTLPQLYPITFQQGQSVDFMLQNSKNALYLNNLTLPNLKGPKNEPTRKINASRKIVNQAPNDDSNTWWAVGAAALVILMCACCT